MAIISNLVFNHSLLVKTNKILLKRNAAAYSHNMSTMKYIQLEPQGDIAILRINRPEALNAMNVDVISELSKMLDILAADDSIKAVVITGAGERSFCAGADISYMVNIDPMQAEKYATSAQDVINRIDRLEKPVIAAVNGFALGGGWRACNGLRYQDRFKQCQDGAARSDNRHTSRMGWNTTPDVGL